MSNKKPAILSVQMGLLYASVAAFSLGIASQQIALHLLAIVQLGIGAVYGLSVGSLFAKGRRSAVVFLLVTIVITVITQQYYPAEEARRIHWAIAAFWVVGPGILTMINWETLHRVILALSAPGLIYSVYWLLQPAEIMWAIEMDRFSNYPRAEGLVSNPITWAEGLVVFGSWSLSRLSNGLKGKERKWVIAHLILSVLVVLFSRVRAGIVGFVVLFLLNGLVQPRFRKLSVGLCVGLVSVFILSTALFGFNTASLQERFELAGNSVELFKENPIIGIGPNKYGQDIEGVGVMTAHPHNTILGMATELGILGLACYLAFMISLGRAVWLLMGKHGRIGQPNAWLVHALLYVFVLFHVFGLFDYNYADTELLILHALHWAFIALLANPAEKDILEGDAHVR